MADRPKKPTASNPAIPAAPVPPSSASDSAKSNQLALTHFEPESAALREELAELRAQSSQYERHVAELNGQLDRRNREHGKVKWELTKARREAEAQRALVRSAQARARRADEELELLRSSALVRLSTWSRQLGQDFRSSFNGNPRLVPQRLTKLMVRRKRHARERAVIAASGLFDFEFYATQEVSLDPIGHYLTRGARAGLDPSPHFQTQYYVANCAEAQATVQNPLVHYLEHGERAGKWPSVEFDPTYYAATYPEACAFAHGLLAHYARLGAQLRLSTRRAEAKNLPVVAPAQSPGARLAPKPTTPTLDEWRATRPHTAEDAQIDVIVPVYRGEADTLRCIERVLSAKNQTKFELIVIDDCSPEPNLTAELQKLARNGRFTYLRNEQNRGFVGTVNRGLVIHPDRDVVLLNSDTEVYNDWLDRLCNVAKAHARVGTVTPFSNNATICSYPSFARDNDMALELSFEELDALAADVNREIVQELPTGVGFCLYVARACLDEVGLLDEELFGRGYGEENDLCRRALSRGWSNLLACDVFVRHTGGASFQGERVERMANALKVLGDVHPEYQDEVRAFVRTDPIMPARARLDLERARRCLGERALAILSHNRGGGTEIHVQQLLTIAVRENVAVLLLRPNPKNPSSITLSVAGAGPMPNLPELRLDAAPELAAELLASLGVRQMHVHHLVDLTPNAPRWIASLARTAPFPVDYTVHDYSPICPRINLVNDSGVYCGEPDEGACDRCIAKLGSSYGITAISPFRRKYREMLMAMRHVFAPNEDVKQRLARYMPELAVTVRPHPDAVGTPAQPVRAPAKARPRVAVLGAIGFNKGYNLLIRCAEDARKRELPIDFVVIGFTRDDPRAKRAGIEVTGAYANDDEALEHLARIAPQLCFLPSVCPETHSFTLSIALAAGLNTVAFAFGAIAERLNALETGTLLPLDMMRDPARVNDALVELAHREFTPPPPVAARTYTFEEYYQSSL